MGDGNRTRNNRSHSPVLCQLSYSHRNPMIITILAESSTEHSIEIIGHSSAISVAFLCELGDGQRPPAAQAVPPLARCAARLKARPGTNRVSHVSRRRRAPSTSLRAGYGASHVYFSEGSEVVPFQIGYTDTGTTVKSCEVVAMQGGNAKRKDRQTRLKALACVAYARPTPTYSNPRARSRVESSRFLVSTIRGFLTRCLMRSKSSARNSGQPVPTTSASEPSAAA